VVLDFIDTRVWDSSGVLAINELARKLVDGGSRVHLRHLSSDCRKLLGTAGDLVDVEVNVLEDPKYGLLASYDDIADKPALA